MTIASEITRLQTDKESIRQAIIDKGVDVAVGVSLDDYAACIAAIPTGGGYAILDYLIIGGGGGAGLYGGGGGGGEVLVGSQCLLEAGEYPITVGLGGIGGYPSQGGGDSCFAGLVAHGGCTSGDSSPAGRNGGASGSGCSGGAYVNNYQASGGGGGAGGNGYNGCTSDASTRGRGGDGICGYGGGGGGYGYYWSGPAVDGGGNGGCRGNGANGNKYGGGGGGTCGCGYQGAIIVCHPEGCSYKISGQQNKYVCNGYCVYEFTCNGTMVVS